MRLGTISKQPADFLDYDIDYSEWLLGNDAINEITVDVTRDDGAGLSSEDLEVRYVINNNPIVKLWLANGVDQERYKIEVTIRTNNGRIKQVELRTRVRDI